NKKDNPRKDHFQNDRGRREQKSSRSYYNPLNASLTQFLHEASQGERVLAPRPIKNTHRGDRSSYCKYYKQNEHDTEECRDLLDFVEQGLKNGKFREYTSRYKQRDDDRRVRQWMNSLENKADKKRDEPKDRGTHRKLAMISRGIPEERNPLPRKQQKEAGTHAW
ncbi:hypothetical protein PIB30_100000, partial [Stylosanthes scabra]|nr:hypothetical protein [Stylosanthes scabra]